MRRRDLPTLSWSRRPTCGRRIPIIETRFAMPPANNFGMPFSIIGTVNPGLIWVGNNFQVGIEAQLPINAAGGKGVGVLAQRHLYLDDILPTNIGQPLLRPNTPRPQQLF